jgi:hypothetical protein
MDRGLLSGSVPLGQRVAAVLVWLVGLTLAGALLVFGFFVGAALLGIAAVAGLVAWARLRWGKPIFPGQKPRTTAGPPRTGETIIDAEYVVIRRDDR